MKLMPSEKEYPLFHFILSQLDHLPAHFHDRERKINYLNAWELHNFIIAELKKTPAIQKSPYHYLHVVIVFFVNLILPLIGIPKVATLFETKKNTMEDGLIKKLAAFTNSKYEDDFRYPLYGKNTVSNIAHYSVNLHIKRALDSRRPSFFISTVQGDIFLDSPTCR